MFRIYKKYIDIKVILGAIFFAVCIFAILLGILWSARADDISQAPGTALLNIIEAQTETPPFAIVTLTPTLDSLSTQVISIPGEEISIGDYVQVIGTGGEGLRLHATAGVSRKVDYIAIDSEVFLVKGGPMDADGYSWWMLQDPFTENVVGWGVANYLSVVQNP
jgi:hypothetical protein